MTDPRDDRWGRRLPPASLAVWVAIALTMLFPVLPTFAQPLGLPPAVAAATDELLKECRELGLPAHADPSFVQRVNISDDGVDDYVLDTLGLSCGGVTAFCGSAGCPFRMFASVGDRHLEVFSDQASWVLRRERGRVLLRLSYHGSFCDRVGSADCLEIHVWDDSRFRLICAAGSCPPESPARSNVRGPAGNRREGN